MQEYSISFFFLEHSSKTFFIKIRRNNEIIY